MMQDVLDSPWGRLFRNWETLTADRRRLSGRRPDAAQIEKTGMRALRESLGILGTCIKEAPEFARRARSAESSQTATCNADAVEHRDIALAVGTWQRSAHDLILFTVRSDNVDVEQIMRQIRSRIREKRGVDYTEEEIRELANVKLEKFLDPRGVRSDLLEQFRRSKAAMPAPPNFEFEETTLYETHRGFIRWIRKLLNPILKLFFNPNPLIQALHIQSELNTRNAKREELDTLHYEVIHNLVSSSTRPASR